MIAINAKVKLQKNMFAKVEKAVVKMNITSLGHAGASVRQWARRSIKFRADKNKHSVVGTPPYTHNSRRYGNRVLKNSILYKVEKAEQRVYIGSGFSKIIDVGTAHELGGIYRYHKARRARFFFKRPFMLPALMGTLPKVPSFWQGKLKVR